MKNKNVTYNDVSCLAVPMRLSDSELLTYIQTDINWKYVDTIKKLTGFNDNIISDWLNVSIKTFRSYRLSKNGFKQNVKEQIVLLLSLMNHGIHVFGNETEFKNWLNVSNFYFDNKTPNQFLNTITGIKFVDERLTAMEYGDNI